MNVNLSWFPGWKPPQDLLSILGLGVCELPVGFQVHGSSKLRVSWCSAKLLNSLRWYHLLTVKGKFQASASSYLQLSSWRSIASLELSVAWGFSLSGRCYRRAIVGINTSSGRSWVAGPTYGHRLLYFTIIFTTDVGPSRPRGLKSFHHWAHNR